jgi:hypothetical protein
LTFPSIGRKLFIVWTLLVGCDAGDAPLSLGPRPRIVRYQPRSGEGLDCEPSESGCGFPANQPLVFELDRWLLPSTATRQSIRVSAVGTDGLVHWEPFYDLVTRTVTYRPGGGWADGYLYDLRLYDPTLGGVGWGFRSYDSLLLDPEGLPEHILFHVGPSTEQAAALTTHTACRDALQAFAAAGCTRSNCHATASGGAAAIGGYQPSAGLALDSAKGLSAAIGRVARATDRGAQSGVSAKIPERFGVNMALLDAGEPSLSLVLYRMLLARDAYKNQDGEFALRPPPDEELERATSWFGVMGSMPPSEVGWPAETSPIDLVTAIQRWIRGGATTDDCD